MSTKREAISLGGATGKTMKIIRPIVPGSINALRRVEPYPDGDDDRPVTKEIDLIGQGDGPVISDNGGLNGRLQEEAERHLEFHDCKRVR